MIRIILTTVILQGLVLTGPDWCIKEAYAGTPDKPGNNAEISSISITPNFVLAGTYPEISGFVLNTSSSMNGDNGKAAFDVMAVITLPNGSQKNLLWHKVSFSVNQRKFYTYVKNYDINQIGTYKIEYFIYNIDRTHLYTSLSKSFIVSNPKVTSKPTATVPKAANTGQSKKESMPKSANRLETPPQQTSTMQTKKPSAYDRPAKTDTGEKRKYIGIGGSVNTFNFSGGPSLILWPLKNLAIQGTYGFGTFTSYEARAFYRFPLSKRLNPYLGAGYLHSERSTSVIGVDTKIKGDSYTGFAGVELPIYKNLYGYADISGTPLKLKKDVTNGALQTTTTVKYSAITICTGLVLYLF